MVSSGRHAISCILLIISIVSFAQAQTAPEKTSGATITGKVTMKGKGAPGIAVVLVLDVQGEQRVTRYKALTDDTGTYRITNVPPGKYGAQTVAPAFVGGRDGRLNPFGNAATLLINKDETVENINFELLRGGVITGKVTDSDGHPLIEETVSIRSAEPNPSYGSEVRRMQTDDRGVYRIFGIPPGAYKVAVGSNEPAPSWEIPRFPQTFYPDATDASQATTIDVTEGSETTNVDITVKGGERTYSIRGRIIDGDTGRPVANVPYGITAYISPNTTSGLSDGSMSNSDGEFKWENLRPGKYSVHVDNVSDSAWHAEEAPFEVSDRDITGLVVKLLKSTTASGVIVLEGTEDKSVLAKLRRASASVRIEVENRIVTTGSTGIQPDGKFRFSSLPAGVATFGVEGKGFELVRVERNGVVQPAAIPIRDREQITGLRLVVRYYDASIRGVIKVENDAPLPANAKFYVSLKKAGEPVRQFDQPGSYQSVDVDSRGQFVAEGLSPGTYEVIVQSYGPNEARSQVLMGKQQVTVTDGAVANITVTLQPMTLINRP